MRNKLAVIGLVALLTMGVSTQASAQQQQPGSPAQAPTSQ